MADSNEKVAEEKTTKTTVVKEEKSSGETKVSTENGSGDKAEVTIKAKEEKTETKVTENGSGDKAEPAKEVKQEKTEPKVEMDPELLAKKIKRQIEYYFGDYNLPTDKFLRSCVAESDGWVPIDTMLKFKRLASLTDDRSVIISALTGSNLIEISEDKLQMRRHPDKPLPVENEERRKEVLTRSVYVKGFPEEFTIDNALDYFENYGNAADVVMRYLNDKATKTWKFKGSVFVKFDTKEDAAAFLARDDVKFNGEPLIKSWQSEYIERKRSERLEQRLMKKRPEGSNDKPNVKAEERGLPKGATLHMTKCPDGLTREQVKERLEELGLTVAFIDYSKGADEGWIRLHEEGSAAKLMDSCEGGKLKLKDDVEVEVKPLEGEEEETFLTSAKESINARRAKGGGRGGRGGRRGGRGGGRGGGGGGNWRKRKHDNDSGEPKAKVSKAGGD